MNKVVLMGRLTADPEVRYAADGMAIGRYTLAVDRRYKGKDGKKEADFVNCTCFGTSAEFVQKYFFKGTKVAITGRLSSSKYEKDGKMIYRTEVITEEQEFAESKKQEEKPVLHKADEFVAIPDGVDEELPFA